MKNKLTISCLSEMYHEPESTGDVGHIEAALKRSANFINAYQQASEPETGAAQDRTGCIRKQAWNVFCDSAYLG